jgi:hypothetical protein
MKKFLPLMLVLLALLPTDVLAVGETCELSTGQNCLLPYEVGSAVNYNVDGNLQIGLCSSGFEFCETEVQGYAVGSFTYVVRQYNCGGLGCTYVNVVSMLGSLNVGYGVPAPPFPTPTPTPTPIPSSSGLFDSFDLGLTIEAILSEVVGFLSSSLVVSILAAMLALISVPRVLAFFRRMF